MMDWTPVEQLYPEALRAESEYISAPSDYTPIINSFGYVVEVRIDDEGYTGDVRLLLRNGYRFGLLIFGYGSCSGCDALLGCDTMKDIADLRREMHEQIKWFVTSGEVLCYIKQHDWEGDFIWHSNKAALDQFIAKAVEVLGDHDCPPIAEPPDAEPEPPKLSANTVKVEVTPDAEDRRIGIVTSIGLSLNSPVFAVGDRVVFIPYMAQQMASMGNNLIFHVPANGVLAIVEDSSGT